MQRFVRTAPIRARALIHEELFGVPGWESFLDNVEHGSSSMLFQPATKGMFRYNVLSTERALFPPKAPVLSLPVSLLLLLCFLKTIMAGEFLGVCDSADIKSLKLFNH